MLIKQEQAIAMLTRHDAMIANPVHQFARDGLYLSIGVGLLFGQDVPDHDQQFASDGDNRLLFAHAPGQVLKLSFPMGMMLHRNPGGLDHHAPHIAPALFGNMSASMGFSRVMDAGS